MYVWKPYHLSPTKLLTSWSISWEIPTVVITYQADGSGRVSLLQGVEQALVLGSQMLSLFREPFSLQHSAKVRGYVWQATVDCWERVKGKVKLKRRIKVSSGEMRLWDQAVASQLPSPSKSVYCNLWHKGAKETYSLFWGPPTPFTDSKGARLRPTTLSCSTHGHPQSVIVLALFPYYLGKRLWKHVQSWCKLGANYNIIGIMCQWYTPPIL